MSSKRSILTRCAAVALFAALPFASRAGNPDTEQTRVVSDKGLDLTTPAGAHEFYKRLLVATDAVCGLADREDPLRHAGWETCREKALAGAVRAVNRPLVTQLYAAEHEPKVAEKYGFDYRTLLSAK